ncbi:DHHA1 domain-containing protein [Mesomycoplasma hyopneumoniae]
MENGIRVRIRSNGPKVNKIASEYGGGGHEYAAGINLEKSEKTKEISQEIIEKLVIQVKEFEQNE